MGGVSTYLNFMGDAEEAFTFYGKLFGSDNELQIVRMSEMSAHGGPDLTDSEKGLVAHAVLPILGGHVLMGSDMLESMGHQLRKGNNVTINMDFDTRAEADRFYAELSAGGSDSTGMQDMPWGYWGCTEDKYGIRWMFNCQEQKS